MEPGTRIVVTSTVWPERAGCLGTVVEPPPGWGDTYPADKHGVLVLLDEDPLGATETSHHAELEFTWTCRYSAHHVEEWVEDDASSEGAGQPQAG